MPYQISLAEPAELSGTECTAQVWFKQSWMQAVASVIDASPKLLLCHDKDNLVAVMPLYSKKKLWFIKAYNPLLAYYCPIVFTLPETSHKNRSLIRETDICAALAMFLKQEFREVFLNLSPQLYDVRGFTWQGLVAQPLYTFVQKTDEKQELMTEERHKLRLAERHGFEFEERFDVDQFCHLLRELHTLKGHDMGMSLSAIRLFLSEMHKEGLVKQLNVMDKGEVVSSDIIVCDGTDTAYALLRGTTIEGRKKGASVMQNVYDAKYLASSYRFLDYLGGNIPGPARFKAACGYNLKLFFRIRSK